MGFRDEYSEALSNGLDADAAWSCAADVAAGEIQELHNALAELVFLKVLKDSQGKTPEYLERQPKAWAEAIRLVSPNPAEAAQAV